MLRIAWLTTGRGPGSYGALEYLFAALDRGLAVQVAAVFVNRDPGEAEATDRLMAMVRKRGIPLETLSSVRFRKAKGGKLSRAGEPLPAWRTEFDAEVARRLSAYDFDLGLMFGYMLIATPPLFEAFRFLNDHPALPEGPVGTWQRVIIDLIRGRAEESGCMWNVVTGDLDRGPVVSFCRYSIAGPDVAGLWAEALELGPSASDEALEGTPLFAEIRRRGLLVEKPFMVETLRAISEGRLRVPPAEPADLTFDVNRAIRREI